MQTMSSRNTNELWSRLASTSDETLPLLGTALLIAQDEYPDLDIAEYERSIAWHADALARRIGAMREPHLQLSELNHYVFFEQGFSGNQGDYYDPRNCYINDVLDRKLGIPITLAVVQIELARRVGVPLEGVSFPGHFLVRMPLDGGLVVMDPFHQGRSIGVDELKQRAKPHLGGHDIDDGDLLTMLEPASHRAILSRMLRNLKGAYVEREQWDKAVRCADRLLRLDPQQADEQRDRGMFYLKLGHRTAAREDLATYLMRKPQCEDAETVRSALIEASGRPQKLH